MLFKLSNLNSNLALTLGYLNPALNNSAQKVISYLINFWDDDVHWTGVWLSYHRCDTLIEVNEDNCAFTIQHSYFKIQYLTSLIQHCTLTIQHLYFKFYWHATFVCCVLSVNMYGIAFQHSCYFFTNERPCFKSNFPPFTCDIRVVHCDVDASCVCYGAECDVLATQCNILTILVRTLNFTLEEWRVNYANSYKL